MGLDWTLKAKVLEGKEEAHAEARRKRQEAAERLYEQKLLVADPTLLLELDAALTQRGKEECALQIIPYSVLDCPRVGIDDEATAYATKSYEVDNVDETFRMLFPTLESYLAYTDGQYIPDIVRNVEALKLITPRGTLTTESLVDFRAALLRYAEHILGERLVAQAYRDMDPDEMLDYADALEAKVTTLVGMSGEPDDSYVRVCREAVAWLRFWAGHGFSMHAWF